MKKREKLEKRTDKRPDGAVSARGRAPLDFDGLEEQRNAVLSELARLRAQLNEWPTTGREEYDPLQDEYAKNAALAEQYELHLVEIERALQAARNGDYGTCERCGKPISAERLQIMPETRWCVSCRSLIEREAQGRAMR